MAICRLPHILELSVVMQGAMRGSRLLASNLKVVAMPSSFWVATLQAISYPSAMRRG